MAQALKVHFAAAYANFRVYAAEIHQAAQAAGGFDVANAAKPSPITITSNMHDAASIRAAIEARRRQLEAELAELPALQASLAQDAAINPIVPVD